MRRRTVGFGYAAPRLIAAGALASGLVAGHGAAAADQVSIRLTISGLAPGAAYAGTCRLTAAEGPDQIVIEGMQPRTYEFIAAAARCEIDASGGLSVTFEKAGNRSQISTSGGRVVVSIA